MANYDLYLKGYVGEYNFDDDYVDYILSKRQGKEVNVLINSLGGSVASALTIASAFSRHGNVNVHFVGMNASAATIASLGAAHISIDASAMYLVHKCSSAFFANGSMNADSIESFIQALQEEKENLDKIDVNIATMYSKKCKKNVDDLLALMKKGGWLSSAEALEWGFVDEVTEAKEKAPVMTEALASDFTENNIPLPDIPFADKNAFAKFLEAFTALFKSKAQKESTQNTITTMKVESPIIASVLDKELEADDNKVTLTADELASIENTISADRQTIEDLNSQIETLNARIAELSAKPAEETTNVINNGNDNEEEPKSDFAQNYANALELFNEI